MMEMIASRARLQMSIELNRRKKEGLDKKGYGFQKRVHDQHALVFFFIGMSLNLNLDTSLLTAKIFQVENFANITLFLYFGTIIIVVLLYMFYINAAFCQLVGSSWALVASRICHFVLAIFAKGKAGRNWFLVFYTVNGFLRGVISLTSTHVISKFFLNDAYLHFLNGGVFFSILVSVLQMICDAIIGTETVKQARYSLIVGQGFYLFETILAAAWITTVYLIYGMNGTGNENKESCNTFIRTNGKNGEKNSNNKFTYIKYYMSKMSVVTIASFLRVIFHPVMIPFMMDIQYIHKLCASIIFTIFEFFGRLSTLRIDEYIDPTKKSPHVSNNSFLAIQDIHLYLLFAYQMFICSLAIYSCWFQKLGLSENPIFIILVTLTSGFVAGYTDNRGAAGAQAALKYYFTVDQTAKKELEKVVDDTSTVNDILTLCDYMAYLVGCVISFICQRAITSHKDTYEFIVNSKRNTYLDKETVERLMSKLRY